MFRPTQIRYTPLLTDAKNPLYYTSDLLAHGFTAADCARSLAYPSRGKYRIALKLAVIIKARHTFQLRIWLGNLENFRAERRAK